MTVAPLTKHPLAVFLVMVALVVQLHPAGLPILAGMAHTLFHLSDAANRGTVSHHDEPDHHDAHEVMVHSHGPGEPLHSHTVVVDRVMTLAEGGDHPEVGPAPSGQVDRYLPPAQAAPARQPDYAALEPEPAEQSTLFLNAAPPVPPPKG